MVHVLLLLVHADAAGITCPQARVGLCTRGFDLPDRLTNLSWGQCCEACHRLGPSACAGVVYTPLGRSPTMSCYLKSQLAGLFAGNCTTGAFTSHPLPPAPAPSPAPPAPPAPAPAPDFKPRFNYVQPRFTARRVLASLPGYDIRDSTTAIFDPVSRSWHLYCTHQTTGLSAYQVGTVWHWSLKAERFDDPSTSWQNEGAVLNASGVNGTFDAHAVFTPGAVRECSPDNQTCSWHLFFGGVSTDGSAHAESVGVAVAASPYGPFVRYSSQPVFSMHDRNATKWCTEAGVAGTMVSVRMDEIKPVEVGGAKYLAVKCVCGSTSGKVAGENVALPVLYAPLNGSSWAPPYRVSPPAVSPLFRRSWSCEGRGFEEPTFFSTEPDGYLHFIAHDHGQCANRYAHFISKSHAMSDWVQVPSFGGSQGPRKCCNDTFQEPIPVPVRGDGVFGGEVYESWIDFGTWMQAPGSRSIQLILSTVTWEWQNASVPFIPMKGDDEMAEKQRGQESDKVGHAPPTRFGAPVRFLIELYRADVTVLFIHEV